MSLHLPAHVHVARIARDLIFLDIANDGYFCVADAIVHDDIAIIDPDCAAELCEAQLLHSEPAPGNRPLAVSDRSPAWRDLELAGHPRIAATDLFLFLITLIKAALRFRGRSLPRLIAYAERSPGRRTSTGQGALAHAADVYERLALWLPFRPLCLFRSFHLLHYLRAKRLDAAWVFGVELYPFRAHCWLACDDSVVGDAAHRLGSYQPILIVGRTTA